uniref:Quaking_NLS domain-containing protein n=1 Tax=Heterorhabditis bacteriophora TaxID=37862 RepID=A0A1I7XBG5_HETBA
MPAFRYVDVRQHFSHLKNVQ